MRPEKKRSFAAGLAISIAVAPFCRQLALKIGMVSRVRPDRWKTSACPTLGGGAFLLAASLPPLLAADSLRLWESLVPLLTGSAVAFGVGWIDDSSDLGPGQKIAGLLLARVVECGVETALRKGIPRPESSAIESAVESVRMGVRPMMESLGGLAVEGARIAIGPNLINLFDNIDGVLFATAALAFASLADDNDGPDASLAAAASGGALGILACNAYPAAILPGDTGSLSIGYLLARLASRQSASLLAPAPWSCFALPAADTLFVLAQRLYGRRPLVRGNTDHLAHRLGRTGLTEPLATLILVMLQVVILAGSRARTRDLQGSELRGSGRSHLLTFTSAAVIGCIVGRAAVRRSR